MWNARRMAVGRTRLTLDYRVSAWGRKRVLAGFDID